MGHYLNQNAYQNWNTHFFYYFPSYIRMWKKNKNEKTVDK